MGGSTTLSIILKLVDDASSAMQGVGANLKSVGDSMTSAGRTLSTEVTLPIVALGTAVIATSTKFQASMELIRTQAGASQQEVTAMTQAVLDLSKSGETAQGPQKLADGLYHLESLGLRGKAAMDALTTAAQAADLGLADMEGVTNALGAAVVTGIKGTQDMNQAMGLLDATIGQGNMRMDDLVAALGTGILPAAKNFGLTLQDVGAALATLTDNGMQADESATRLRMTFSLIAAPTQKAKDALAEVGLGAYQLANDMRGPNGLVTAIDDLKTHLENSGKSATQQAAILSEAFGGGRTSAAILTLVEQSDRLKTKFDAIGASADTFQEKVAATHETNLYKMNAALAQIQTTLIDLGGAVMPMVAQALGYLSSSLSTLTSWWDALSPGVQKFIVIGLALLAVLGPILLIVGSIITVIGTLITIFTAVIPVVTAVAAAILALGAPIILVAAAVALLAVAVFTHWHQIIDWTSDMMLKIAATWNNGWQAMHDWFFGIINKIKDEFQAAMSFVNGIISNITSAISAVTSRISSVGSGAVNIGSSMLSMVPHFASGGIVTSPTMALVGEAGPEAIIPLSAFAGGTSLATGGGGKSGDIIVNILGGNYLDSNGATMIANAIGRQIGRQLKVSNFN